MLYLYFQRILAEIARCRDTLVNLKPSHMKSLISILFVNLIFLNFVQSQCTPPSADNCEDANVICSLNELDGYTCQNTDYSNPTGCSPLCPSGGGAHNTGWWAFVTNGGNVCLTLTFSNCTVNGTGVQFGIWGDCDCSESIHCDPSCTGPGSKIVCGNLTACKTYYLFVDGCTGDVCDITINTARSPTEDLLPLGNIIGPKNLCKDACNVKYSIEFLNKSACKPSWLWTIDGVVLDQYNQEIIYDFPDESDFVLCVTAILGNPKIGSICDQEGPKCITIKVRNDSILTASSNRNICFDKSPVTWGTQTIKSSGTYKQRFVTYCCTIDSTVTFNFLDEPMAIHKYFLGCLGEVYTDSITKQVFSSCQIGTEIILPGKSSGGCDSSYLLTAAFISGTGRMREYCQGEKILLEVTPIDRTCTDGAYITESFNYKWYLKSDSAKKSIGTDEYIEISKKDEYCIEITFKGRLNNMTRSCKFDLCEQYNEDDFKAKEICPRGELKTCIGSTEKYIVEDIFPNDARHKWTVSGGRLITTNSIDHTEIEVKWDFDPSPATQYIGAICYHLESSCPAFTDCCIDVTIIVPKPDAGKDAATIGLRYKLKADNSLPGEWSMSSGPGTAFFIQKTNPNSSVRVTKYGTYKFKWSLTCNPNFYDEVNVTFAKIKLKVGGGYELDTCCTDSLGSKLISRIQQSKYSLYPNPVKSRKIVIEGGNELSNDRIIIYDIYGRQCFQQELQWTSDNVELTLPDYLTRGVYFVRVESELGVGLVEKLVVE